VDKIKAVLEKYKDDFNHAEFGDIVQQRHYEKTILNQAQLQLDALYKARYLGMLPEELNSGIVDIGVGSMPNSYEEGFNLAIQEMKGKLNG